ncbi:hypothetical protein [Haloarcula nitratireducens]|uniref:Uncharacterized protein n=1 Tax=Haloarcula nitratireducens TaxID=2487749 RepID=A0AAW4PIF2_9EURY|nr:hypothetical protein [Halomicroarcula nitratireducens]MBX0297532.1 hypothetical protein [Halomicroarcula nitratireducens]
MVDELRESDIESTERERTIRLHIGEHHDGQIDCFGIIPSLEWDQLPMNVDVNNLLDQVTISASGVERPPVATNFHPTESEVRFQIDPQADKFEIQIKGPDELDAITGDWTADGLASGDIFVGDQSRARRHRSQRQVKEGEWVYLITSPLPRHLPDVVTTHSLGEVTVLAFPAREATEDLLEDYGDGLTTDNYGFDADVILPAHAHPTVEAPIYGWTEETVLVGVTPDDEIDPVFEVVTIPKRAGSVIDLDPTGPGNPRYYRTKVPEHGSRRISIHQRNSSRHRMVHLHAVATADKMPSLDTETNECGINIEDGADTYELRPLGEDQTHQFGAEYNPHLFPMEFAYVGPEGLELELNAEFVAEAPFGPTITEFTTDPESVPEDIVHWVMNGCSSVQIEFDGIGSVTLEFAQPALATTLDDGEVSTESV